MEAGKSSLAAAAALLLPDDLLLEILLRLPPEPIYLFRASFTCKHWRGLVHDARFLRRFREFHGGTPPVLGLGFFTNQPLPPGFVPVSCGFTPSTATMSHDDWWILDCRHGHALLFDCHRLGTPLLILDLVTGDKLYLPFPPAYETDRHCNYNGAVLRAPAHDHRHPRSFLVAFMFSNQVDFITSACLYSSETGSWGETTSIHAPYSLVQEKPMALVGRSLYLLLNNDRIIAFDLVNNSLDLIKELPHDRQIITRLLLAEDGRLGFAIVDRLSIHLWSMVDCIDGVVSWTRRRIVDLEKLFAPEIVAACMDAVWPVGYAEDANVIFIYVYPGPGTYMIHLKSMEIEEVSHTGSYRYFFPYTSFYAPGITTGDGDDQVDY